MYIPNAQPKSPVTDFMSRFSDNLSNDLLTHTISSGIEDSNKALRQAGLTLQNKIINRNEFDQESRKLVEEYDKAIQQTQDVNQTAKDKGVYEQGDWGDQGPQERRLTQVAVAPQTPQVVYSTQPQYFYSPVSTPQPVLRMSPGSIQLQPVPQNSGMVAAPVVALANQKSTVKATEDKKESVLKKQKESTESTKNDKKTNKVKKVKKSQKKNRSLRRKRRKSRSTQKGRKLRHHRHRHRHHRHRHHNRHHHNRHRHRHHHHRRHHHNHHHNHHIRHQKYWHKVRFGHEYLHNHHRVNTPQYIRHNKNYYKNRYHPQWNPYYYYYLKVRKHKNMNYMKQTVTTKLQKAKLAMITREKFDREHEKRIKAAAEMWNRTFIYDSVLLIEKDLYDVHKKAVKKRMSQAAKLHKKATKDIEEFYNKYYEKNPEEIKEEDLIHHIFV